MSAATVRPAAYLPRIVDGQIDHYLKLFGALEITGTKWAGKTWSARAHGASISYVDRGNNPEIAQSDPTLMLKGETPHVIDEWQIVPAIWDTVRHAVDDAAGEKGLWILTGSSTPHKDEVAHSGAGRIGRIRMFPMTLAESNDSSSQVSLAGLFSGAFEPCQAQPDLQALVELACRGGWPEACHTPSRDAQIVVREYLRSLYEQSIPSLGKSGETAERLVVSLARNLGQATTLSVLSKDVLGAASPARRRSGKDGESESESAIASEKTISSYLEALSSLFLIEPLKGWAPPARSPKRVQTKERRYFADPSLAVAALGMSPASLLDDWQTFGLVFENLCIRDLQVYARALPDVGHTPVRYYRDDSGLEVDAIIEKADGSWGAFEIKTSEDKVSQGISSLLRLQAKLDENPLAKMKKPSFLAVLVGVAEYARKTPEGIYVIPVRTLGP
ncbi:MAG: DUF4143 domain-containing protein [Coriobacteriales bacterium]|jgi:predicted AAA+ superfamily ATPase|nr:DUF4143 domain-containing protein [Coriobacteriales bacterium]